ncbi:uncharacterized protein LOC118148617 [Callithrix jacchus]
MRSLSPRPPPPSPPPAPLAARHTRSGSRYWFIFSTLEAWDWGDQEGTGREGGERPRPGGVGSVAGRGLLAAQWLLLGAGGRDGEGRSGEREGGENCPADTEAAGPLGASAVPVPRSSGPARRTQRGWRARATGGFEAPWGARSKGALWRTPPAAPPPARPGPTPLPLPPPRPSPPLSLRPSAPPRLFPIPVTVLPSLLPARSGGDFSAQRRSGGSRTHRECEPSARSGRPRVLLAVHEKPGVSLPISPVGEWDKDVANHVFLLCLPNSETCNLPSLGGWDSLGAPGCCPTD